MKHHTHKSSKFLISRLPNGNNFVRINQLYEDEFYDNGGNEQNNILDDENNDDDEGGPGMGALKA